MSPYTIVLSKIDTCCFRNAACKSVKTVGKDSGFESGGLHCVHKQKDKPIRTGNLQITFWRNVYQLSIAMRSHIFLTCLWVQAYIFVIVAELGFIWYSPSPLWHAGVIIWEMTLTDKIASNSNSKFAGSSRFSLSRLHLPIQYIQQFDWAYLRLWTMFITMYTNSLIES